MTQEALNKIKKGVKDSNISVHVFNLIMKLVLESEKKLEKPCVSCGQLTNRIGVKGSSICIDCSH